MTLTDTIYTQLCFVHIGCCWVTALNLLNPTGSGWVNRSIRGVNMPTPTGNENMSGALTTGQGICWNENHGYYLRDGSGRGELNPDVDCSYFVGYCLQQNGFNVSPNWYTGSMITDLQNYQGFTHFIYDSSFTPMNGDIFVYDEIDPDNPHQTRGHTFFVGENVLGYTSQTNPNLINLPLARIEASSSRGHYTDGYPTPGDQDNGTGVHDEVWVHPFTIDTSHVWHVFRWQGGTPPPQPLEEHWLIFNRNIRRRKNML